MGDLRPTVRVQTTRLQNDENAAIAVFSVTWNLGGKDQDWAYTTTTQLTRSGKVWLVGWSPEVLEPSLAPGERLLLQKVSAKRAGILGAGGVPLVTYLHLTINL